MPRRRADGSALQTRYADLRPARVAGALVTAGAGRGSGGGGGVSARVVIDRNRCIGAGQCVSVSPEIFDQDESGLVVLIDEAAQEQGVRRAVELCPSGAIALVSDVPAP
ncbi:ferredoxin [Nocardia sp. CA-135953]|uniref:ferredoxin n=1 Tax=Nocardia sp. CA-135953 TaxID=3239978 RepID=UPI003D986346